MRSPFHKTAPIDVRAISFALVLLMVIIIAYAALKLFDVPAQTFAAIEWTLAGIVSLTRVIYFIVTGK